MESPPIASRVPLRKRKYSQASICAYRRDSIQYSAEFVLNKEQIVNHVTESVLQ